MFISENFPDYYPENLDCKWNIRVEDDKKIKLTFHLFNVSITYVHLLQNWVTVHVQFT